MSNISAAVDAYVKAETVVKLERTDGAQFTGKLVPVESASDGVRRFALRTGLRGRPTVLTVDDIKAIAAA